MSNILWRDAASFTAQRGQTVVQYGYCEAGPKWFFTARNVHNPRSEYRGYTDSENEARALAIDAVKAIVGAGTAYAVLDIDDARRRLEEVIREERAAERAAKAETRRKARAAKKAESDLPALKQVMVDAHPDRGGTSASFILARQRYLAAKTAAGIK